MDVSHCSITEDFTFIEGGHKERTPFPQLPEIHWPKPKYLFQRLLLCALHEWVWMSPWSFQRSQSWSHFMLWATQIGAWCWIKDIYTVVAAVAPTPRLRHWFRLHFHFLIVWMGHASAGTYYLSTKSFVFLIESILLTLVNLVSGGICQLHFFFLFSAGFPHIAESLQQYSIETGLK